MSRVDSAPPSFLAAGDERGEALRDDPPPELVEQIRSAYPTEEEYDVLLTRKMLRRGSCPYQIPTLAEMASATTSFLRAHVSGDFRVDAGRWLSGGASKLQYAFTLEWDHPDRGPERSDLVVRMEPAESLNTTSRLREFQLLQELSGVIPVPETYWVDPRGEWFPEPAIVYAFASGTTKPSGDRARVSGTGTVFPPRLRSRLGPQFLDHLAALHTHPVRPAGLSAFTIPAAGTTDSVLVQLNRARRVWEEDRGQDLPMVETVGRWLERNAPPTDQPVLVHGDYRSGNFLFDEDTGRITAWLDWERGHVGDRHRDLAWTGLTLFGNTDPDGSLWVCGLVREQEFFDRYAELTGAPVEPEKLHFYRVFNAYQLVVSNFATAYRVLKLHKSHQDVLLAFVEGAVYPLARQMLLELEAGPRVR